HSFWWRWSTTVSGIVRLTRSSPVGTSLPDLTVAWYTGKALSNLVRVASFDFTNALQDPFLLAVRGTNYVIAVDTEAGPNQTVQLDFRNGSPCDNFKQRGIFTAGTT